MERKNKSPGAAEAEKIAALVRRLRDTERELRELTGGQLNAVAGAGGGPHPLREAQEKLRHSESAQRQLVETQIAILNALPAHIALVDSEGVIVSVNEAWRRFGAANAWLSSDFGVGQNYLTLCDQATGACSEEARAVAAGLRSVLGGQCREFAIEYPCHGPDAPRWFRLMVTPLYEDRPAGAVVTHINITERKLAELEKQKLVHELGERVKELRALHGVADLLERHQLTTADLVARVAALLPGAMQFSEAAAARVGFDGVEQATPNFRASPWRLRADFTAAGAPGLVEVVYLTEQPAAASGPFLKEEQDLIDSLADMLRAYFERCTAEAALRASEASMAAAQRVAHFGSWELELTNQTDINANPLRWSDEMFRIAGYEPGSVAVSNELFFQLAHPEDHELIRCSVAEAIRQRSQYSIVHRLIRPDGEERVVHEVARIFFDAQTAQPKKMVGTMHDITDQRRAETTLRRTEELYRRAIGAAGAVPYAFDFRTRSYLFMGEGIERLIGYPPQEVTGDLWRQIIEEAVMQGEAAGLTKEEAAQRVLTGELRHWQCDTRVRTRAGESRWIADASIQNVDNAGKPISAIGILQDITERKLVELRIKETEERYRALFERSLDAVYVNDLQGRFLDANPAALQLLGYTKEDIRQLDFAALLTNEADLARAMQSMQNQLTTHVLEGTAEYQLKRKDGSLIWVELVSGLVFSAGRPVASQGIARDITERKRAERRVAAFAALGRRLGGALTAREAARIIVDTADELFGWDACWLDDYNAASNRARSILNVDVLEGRRQDVPPAYDDATPSPLIQRVLASGPQLILRESPEMDGANLAPYGDTARASASLMIVPVRHGGEVIAVLSIQSYTPRAYRPNDLADLEALADHCGGALARIRAHEARLESEERFRQMAENINKVFWITDTARRQMLYVSPAYETIWGRTCESLYQSPRGWLEAIHPDDRARIADAAQTRQISGGYDEVYRITRPDGEVRWVRDRAFPVRNTAGGVYRIVGTAEDITERKLAEAKLAEQAALLDAAHEAILVKDLADRIVYWNKGAERLYGWTATEALGRKSVELLYRDPTAHQTALAQLLENGEWHGEMEKRSRDGRTLRVEVRWTLVQDADRKPRSILAINSDITEKKKLEAHFLRAQRMESIGTLAGGIAHDLNNILAPIMMSVQMLHESARTDEERAILSTLQQSAQRGADLVKQVLTFARGIEGQRVLVNPVHLVRDIRKIVQDTFPRNIEFKLEAERHLWPVTGDPTQLHQVIMNLCVNARDAMPDGGKLTVTLGNRVIDEVYAGMNPESRAGAYVLIKVADTGTGMPPEIQDKIFEPFFTTKEVGKGTGLGLSTTLAIVKSHGGFINVYSEVGKGTKFKVHLPAQTTAQAVESATVEQTQPPRGKGELILVVDDEASIRSVARKTLERFGYRVLLATQGAEAVALYAQQREEIAAVLTDMAMPVMDGPSTIIALKAMNPALKIIGSSGLTTNEGLSKLLGAGVERFVPKPYTAEVLLNTLREVLNQPPGPEPERG